MDINLDTLKGEILDYLEAGGFAVFHSTPGGLEGMPLVVWNAEAFPDYQMFLQTATSVGARLILFATSEFAVEEIDAAMEELESCDLARDERRDLEARLNELRPFAGVICSLEMAYDYQSRFYVYEVRPDWYEEFLSISDEIDCHLPTPADDDNGSLGGYFFEELVRGLALWRNLQKCGRPSAAGRRKRLPNRNRKTLTCRCTACGGAGVSACPEFCHIAGCN